MYAGFVSRFHINESTYTPSKKFLAWHSKTQILQESCILTWKLVFYCKIVAQSCIIFARFLQVLQSCKNLGASCWYISQVQHSPIDGQLHVASGNSITILVTSLYSFTIKAFIFVLNSILSFLTISIPLAYIDKCDVCSISSLSTSCLKSALKVLEDSDILYLSCFTISSGGGCIPVAFLLHER